MDEEVKKQIEELTELNKQLLERVDASEIAGKSAADKMKKLAKAAHGEMCELEGGGEGVYDENGECVPKEDEKAEKRLAEVPEEIKKQLATQADEIKKARAEADAAQTRIAKMEDERIVKQYAERVAAEYPSLPVKADEFAPVLRKAESVLDDAGKAELNRVLKAADAAMRAAMGEMGRNGGAPAAGSAYTEMESKAEELRKTEPKITREQAFAKAMVAHPDLARRVRDEESHAH